MGVEWRIKVKKFNGVGVGREGRVGEALYPALHPTYFSPCLGSWTQIFSPPVSCNECMNIILYTFKTFSLLVHFESLIMLVRFPNTHTHEHTHNNQFFLFKTEKLHNLFSVDRRLAL